MPEEGGYRLCPVHRFIGFRAIKRRSYRLSEEAQPPFKMTLMDGQMDMLLKRVALVAALPQEDGSPK